MDSKLMLVVNGVSFGIDNFSEMVISESEEPKLVNIFTNALDMDTYTYLEDLKTAKEFELELYQNNILIWSSNHYTKLVRLSFEANEEIFNYSIVFG